MQLSANIVCIEVSFTNIHKTYVGGYKMVKKTTLALSALAVTVLMTACGRADGSGNTAAQEPTESIMQTDIVQSGTENGSSGTTEITGNTQNSTGEAASEAPGRIPDKPSEELTCPLIGGQYGQDIEHSADYRYNENTDSWDEIYTVGDVSLVYSVSENKITIEYDGRTDEVAWAIQHFGGGVGMSIGLVDMTWDGSEEFILEAHDRELGLYFVYDLKNEKDLSPYYCTDASNIFSAYLKEEYAAQLKKEVNEGFTAIGKDDIFSDVNGDEDLVYFSLRSNADGVEMFENVVTEKRLCYHWYSPGAAETYWNVDFDFTFDESGCHIGNILTVNKEVINAVPEPVKQALAGTKEVIYRGEALENVDDLDDMQYEQTGRRIEAGSFSVLDFDGDGLNEVAVIAEPCYIFHTDGDKVYVYDINYRAFLDLKTDATWNGSGGASNWYYVEFTGFTDTEMLYNTYLHIYEDTYWDGDYYSGNAKQLTKEEADAIISSGSDVMAKRYKYSENYFKQ